MEKEDWGVSSLLSHTLRPFTTGSLADSGPTFIAYFIPQRYPFRSRNGTIRILSAKALRAWHGNIVVGKVDAQGQIIDVEEQDVGLIEHLVLK